MFNAGNGFASLPWPAGLLDGNLQSCSGQNIFTPSGMVGMLFGEKWPLSTRVDLQPMLRSQRFQEPNVGVLFAIGTVLAVILCWRWFKSSSR